MLISSSTQSIKKASPSESAEQSVLRRLVDQFVIALTVKPETGVNLTRRGWSSLSTETAAKKVVFFSDPCPAFYRR